ncbi:MAG: VWA domain-containing protein [Pseudomonadota bacterium]
MPDTLHFIRPEWLWGVPLVIAAAIMLARRSLREGSWQHIIDPALAPHVLSGSARQSSTLAWWLTAIAGCLGCVALAGPAFERLEQPVFRSDQAMVVAIDMSFSMDAQDVAPSRLSRARLKILDLLERRETGQTALVVYSANAFTVTPLTNDADTITSLVNSLSTDIMPSRGSYPKAAIDKGQQLLEQAGVSYGEVLLMTDGGISPPAERAARELQEAGFSLSVLGVGTPEGAPIPKAGGGFVTDRGGNIVVPKLDEDGLRDLAEMGGGRYARLTADNRDLDYILSGEVMAQGSESDGSMATDQWREEGPWLALLLLPLAALAFRRGWVMLLLVFVVPLPTPVHASPWDDLWLTKDQQARRALESGDAATAAELFTDPDWQAVANYRRDAFEQSAAQFSGREDARNLYNFGNALTKLGQLEPAIEAYERALELDPDDEDAAYNRDLVKELLEQQQQQEQEQQSEQGEGDGEQSEDQQGEQSEQEGEQNASDQGDSSESQGNDEPESDDDMQAMQEELQRAAEEQQEQQMSPAELAEMRRAQEQEQAMEQWLRRIPNDPGGLLRRKFRYQYQRMGEDQDGNSLWPDDEVQPW